MKHYFLVFLLFTSFNLASQNLEQDLQSIFNDFQLMGMSVWTACGDNQEEYHFGLRDLTRNLSMNSESKYRIASVSKTFTALGLMKLFDQGEFELDDDISDYLGYIVVNPNHPTVPITFRKLLSHTSSLQDGSGYNNFLNATFGQLPVPSIATVIVPGGNYYTANMWRQEMPGNHFAYSNINYGLIGTLIEKISGQRFDQYMKTEILEPLEINGTYNVSQVPDIDDVAVLYRKISGNWVPQVDNYQGIAPNAPNLGSYIPGTNGAYFGPQGGLRATAAEVGKLMRFLHTNGQTIPGLISPQTLEEMKAMQWNYTGNNGDNYFGLFNRWGLGLHHANLSADDQICLNEGWGPFIGHPGEAYGLVSDAYFSSNGEVSFVFMTNGAGLGYQFGSQSVYYTVEEEVFSSLCNHFTACISTNTNHKEVTPEVMIFPNPVTEVINLQFVSDQPQRLVKLIDVKGREVLREQASSNQTAIDLTALPAGVYLLIVSDGDFVHSSRIVKL